MFCVEVAINLPVKNIFRQFSYTLPAELEFLDRGWRVVVGFNGQTVEGFIVAKYEKSQEELQSLDYQLKPVEAALGREPWFDEEMLATAEWLSSYYMCSLAEAMRLFVPGKTSIKRRAVRDDAGRLLYYTYKERLTEMLLVAYRLTEQGQLHWQELPARAKAQRAAMEQLAYTKDWFTVAELEEMQISATTAKALVEKGMLEQGQKRILRNSYKRPQRKLEQLNLTAQQQHAVNILEQELINESGQGILLQGITGSGKTEVYLRAAAAAVDQGKQVLMLVPEIALTAQLVNRFHAWFGNGIAVAHSKLSQNERGDVWYRMRTGEARVLIGVRSAVFAPFDNLGLVIIDEEHETSYKQEERPTYHAREVAAQRCRNTGAPLLLGSATPDLCTYYKALQGTYLHLQLTERPNGAVLPQVEIVDMRNELAQGNYSVLSHRLQQQLINTAAQGEQAIVLLNRRGYSTFVQCRDCGTSISCPHCAVAMVYHSANEDMRCHYCGNTAPIPKVCPSCNSKRIKFFGTGTQKAEAELAQLPHVRVLRMDQDSTAAKFAHEDILRAFAKKQGNVLIGTQMVAKGHDIPNVTMVGVLAADTSLNLPDYRASERTFSLLTQAAGRAGRGRLPGRVVFQAYEAESPILRLAATQDYDTFAKGELQARERFMYPPFTQLLKITIWDKDENAASTTGTKIVEFLQQLGLQDLLIMGPFPALVGKVRDMYRYNILLKATAMEPVRDALWRSEFRQQKNIYFDVDPVSVL